MQKKCLWLAVLFTFVFGLLPVSASGDITVFVSIEGYTIGHGFFVEPLAVTLTGGSNVMDATIAALQEHNLTHDGGATGISRINGLNAGAANPPGFIMDAINDLDGTEQWGTVFTFTPQGSPDGSLGNNDYFTFAGWMFTVNHVLPDVGAGVVIPEDGDVIRWQFSMLMGDDIGFGWGEPLYTHADKTDLIRALFVDSATPAAREAALAVIIDPLATAAQVSAALNGLLLLLTTPPTGVPGISGLVAAMFAVLAVSAGLWAFMLRDRLWSRR